MKYVLLIFLMCAPLQARDWPNVLGPDHDNTSPEKIANTDWNASAPKILWQRELGFGYSSFAVVGEHAYCMGHVAGKEFVYKLDAKTGKPVWMHHYTGKLMDHLHRGGPAATPLVEDDRVYILGREGQFMALNAADGKPVWERDLRKDFDVKVPEWGFSGSPVIHGELLILQGGPLAAYNKTTGEPVWETEEFKHGYGSARLFDHEGQTFISVLTNDGVLITDLEGKEIARHLWKTSFRTNSTTPIIRGNQIFISTGYRRGCTLLDFDGKTLTEVYENRDRRQLAQPRRLHPALRRLGHRQGSLEAGQNRLRQRAPRRRPSADAGRGRRTRAGGRRQRRLQRTRPTADARGRQVLDLPHPRERPCVRPQRPRQCRLRRSAFGIANRSAGRFGLKACRLAIPQK